MNNLETKMKNAFQKAAQLQGVPRKSFTTPKGTELPLLNLKGKEYLQIQHRVVWFREDHPTWGILTEIVEHSPTHAIAKAHIHDDEGRTIATAVKAETKQGFSDFLEKAETGAIGRALALCGYGTAFSALDFEEGNRLADAPILSSPIPEEKEDSISKEQAQALADIAYKFGWTDAERKQLLTDFGISTLLDLPQSQFTVFELHLKQKKAKT
jgi:hypothetical protein